MGGIIGAIRPVETIDGTAALHLLKHRMPNVSDVSVIKDGFIQGDSSQGGRQPWRLGSYYLVGDIDIYNIDELTKELLDSGTQCNSGRSGDILLAGWDNWGPELFNKIEGDFALAIYDDNSKELTLARDRAGARPIYYSCCDNQIFFASEYKSILAMQQEPRHVDLNVLQYLQSRKTVPSDKTLFKEINQVPAQSYALFKVDSKPQVTAYWQPRLNLQPHSLDKHSANLREAFLKATERRLPSNQPVVISLSGGIDSIAILGAVREVAPNKEIYTFTVGDAIDDHEIVWAEKVANYYGSNHKSILTTADSLKENLADLVWHLEDPIARTETFMCYILAKEAAKVSDVILRGDGADGLFGGMPRHSLIAKTEKLPFIKFIVDELYGFSQTGIIPNNPLTMPAFKLLLRRKFPSVPLVQGAAPMRFEHQLPKNNTEILNNLLVNGPKHALPMLLQKVERVHAAFGVRCISPFVDSEVINTSLQIPSILKNDGKRNKIVFREAIKPFVPTEFRTRPKHPQRIKEDATFCDHLFEIASTLYSRSSVENRGIFSWQEIDKLLQRKNGQPWKPEHAMRIWTLVLTEIWFRTFVDKSPPETISL